MNTKEAIQAMLDGKKIRATNWHKAKNEYIYFNGKYFQDMTGSQFMFSNVEHNFEIYEEPKPKQTVTIEKWLMKTQHANYETHFILEASREKIELHEKGVYGAKPVKLLDTYEV